MINLEHVNTPQTQAECNCTSPCISTSSLNKASRQNMEEKKPGNQRSQGNNNHSFMETTIGNNAKLVFRIVAEKKIRSKHVPCLQGSGCSLVSQACEMEHIMAFREPVAHSWTSSWVTSAVCVVPPEVNFRDSASCRRGSGCCASTNSARYLCKSPGHKMPNPSHPGIL